MEPPNRHENKAKGDKEALEKRRLAERKGGHERWQDPGKVVEATPDGLGYASAADRYQTGAAQSLKEQRDAVIEFRERKYERARDLNLQKEETRWQTTMEEHFRQEAREQALAEGSKGSRNHSSVAYDTVTLEYHPSPAGQKQKYEDDLLRYKMGVRTETLHRRGAGAGYNPITGEELKPPPIPPKPRDPGGYYPPAGGNPGAVTGRGGPPSTGSSRNNIW